MTHEGAYTPSTYVFGINGYKAATVNGAKACVPAAAKAAFLILENTRIIPSEIEGLGTYVKDR